MKILAVLDRCIAIERGAGEVYDTLAARCTEDSELRDFWLRMAHDERTHALALETVRTRAALEDSEHPTLADGFEEDLLGLEELVANARKGAAQADTQEDAFAIALELELSEIDTIYKALLDSLPASRAVEVQKTRRRDGDPHHAALARTVRARSRDEKNLTRAALMDAMD
jgi:rubrerythrin